MFTARMEADPALARALLDYFARNSIVTMMFSQDSLVKLWVDPEALLRAVRKHYRIADGQFPGLNRNQEVLRIYDAYRGLIR